MRVTTWNMHRAMDSGDSDAGWSALRDTSVALLQETRPPTAAAEGTLLFERVANGSRRTWGTAIWAPSLNLRQLDHRRSERGTAVVAEHLTPAGPVTFISIYAKLEPLLDTSFAITTMHRVLSDLTEFFENPKRRGRIIGGGDFNANPAFDDTRGAAVRGAQDLLFDRLELWGMQSVIPYRENAHPTWFPRGSGKPFQLDHIFVSNEIAFDASPANLVRHDELSDHAQLHVDIDESQWT